MDNPITGRIPRPHSNGAEAAEAEEVAEEAAEEVAEVAAEGEAVEEVEGISREADEPEEEIFKAEVESAEGKARMSVAHRHLAAPTSPSNQEET